MLLERIFWKNSHFHLPVLLKPLFKKLSPCLSLPICLSQDDCSIRHKMLPFSLNYATAALCTSRAPLMVLLYSIQTWTHQEQNLPRGIARTDGIRWALKALHMAVCVYWSRARVLSLKHNWASQVSAGHRWGLESFLWSSRWFLLRLILISGFVQRTLLERKKKSCARIPLLKVKQMSASIWMATRAEPSL